MLGKLRAGFQEERVARFERDVADLHVQSFAVAGHGNHDSIVGGSETSLADRAADQRACVRHDGLDERSFGAGVVEHEDLVGGRAEAADLLQFHDGIDDADEDETVARLQALGGSDGGNHMPAAVDLHQKQPVESPQTCLLDRAADQRAARFDEHLQ